MTDCTDFSEGDEIIVREFRTKIDLPGTSGAWVNVPHGPLGSQVFLPYCLMEKVQPELRIGDVWKDITGGEWYVRKMWASSGCSIMVENFERPSVTYGSSDAGVTVRPLSKFFEEQKPALIRRR